MKFKVEAINHVCIVVRDLKAAERFYVDMLGLQRHHVRPNWLVLNGTSTLHFVPLPEAGVDSSLYHRVQHFALQVDDLRAVLVLLLEHDRRPFQMDFEWNERTVYSPEDSIDFGTGSLFVYDQDGNLVEFLQLGHGIFTSDMQPRFVEAVVEK